VVSADLRIIMGPLRGSEAANALALKMGPGYMVRFSTERELREEAR
jgi:hypothetical protein